MILVKPKAQQFSASGRPFMVPNSLTHSSGTITAIFNGSVFSRLISSDVTMVGSTLYMIYLVTSGGTSVMRISANANSIGPSGFGSWALIGAFYSNGMSPVAFGSFVNIVGVPRTESRVQYLGSIVDGNNSSVTAPAPITNSYFFNRLGARGLYDGAYYQSNASVGVNGVGAYSIKAPSQHVVVGDLLGAGNTGSAYGGFAQGDTGGGLFYNGSLTTVTAGILNGFVLRLQATNGDGGNWGQSGSGGVLDAISLNTAFVGMTWEKISIAVAGWSDKDLKDL